VPRIYHNSIYTALRLKPGLRGKKSKTNGHVISYEARRQPIKTMALSELHRGQIQIHRHVKSLKGEIRREIIKLAFLLYRLFIITNFVLWIPKRQVPGRICRTCLPAVQSSTTINFALFYTLPVL